QSARLLLQPVAAGGVLRPRGGSRGCLGGRGYDPLDREQLRNAAHVGNLRSRPREAPGAQPLSAQERPAADRHECWWRGVTEDRLHAAVSAGLLASEEAHL